jgi:hypothetical protein
MHVDQKVKSPEEILELASRASIVYSLVAGEQIKV